MCRCQAAARLQENKPGLILWVAQSGAGSFPGAARFQQKKREHDFTFWLQSRHNSAKMQRTYRGCMPRATPRDGRAPSDGDTPVVGKHAESDQPYAL